MPGDRTYVNLEILYSIGVNCYRFSLHESPTKLNLACTIIYSRICLNRLLHGERLCQNQIFQLLAENHAWTIIL